MILSISQMDTLRLHEAKWDPQGWVAQRSKGEETEPRAGFLKT